MTTITPGMESIREIKNLILGPKPSIHWTAFWKRVAELIEDDPTVEICNQKMPWQRCTKIEFSRFNGKGFNNWLLRAEYFFEVNGPAKGNWVNLVALHLEGKTIQWNQGFMKTRGYTSLQRKEYIQMLSSHFESHAYDDPLSDFRNLRQLSSLQEYLDAFDELYPRARIREHQTLVFFFLDL